MTSTISLIIPQVYGDAEATSAATASTTLFNLVSEWNKAGRLPNIDIKSVAQLVPFIETRTDINFDRYFNEVLKGIDPQEFDLMQSVIGAACDVSEFIQGKIVVPESSLLIALNQFRHLKFIFGDSKINILDISPGNPYFGAICALEGHKYKAIEFNKGAFLLEGSILDLIAGGNLKNPFNTGNPVTQMPNPPELLPWWSLDAQSNQEFDLIVCSERIAEINRNCQHFLLSKLAKFLPASGWKKNVLMIENSTRLLTDTSSTLLAELHGVGLQLSHNIAGVVICSPSGSQCSFNSFDAAQLDLGKPQRMPEYSSMKNQLSLSIQHGFEQQSEERFIPLEQLNTLYTLLLETDKHQIGRTEASL